MESHEVRYCRIDEVHKLQQFIHLHWKENHILSTNVELLDYQHKNESENRYNFVVAYNKTSTKFDVILGFIPHQQYDSNDKTRNIWLAIWKKNDEILPRGLGTKLLDFLEENYKPKTIGSIGINDNIEQLYLKRGWKSGILDVWYFLRAPRLIEFEKTTENENSYFTNDFAKSETYYITRYERHPFYDYSIYQGIVYRKIITDEGTVLRIIDFKHKFYIDEAGLNELLIKEDADYIDCLNYGLSDTIFKSMGFHKRSDNMHIPQWFEPLDLGVKNIKFAFKSESDYLIVKGDSDQDRPNIIRK